MPSFVTSRSRKSFILRHAFLRDLAVAQIIHIGRANHSYNVMPSFVDLAVAQLKPRKGDYRGNLARLRELFAQIDALEPRPAVVCLPETALTGYFLEGGDRDHAVTAGTLARDLDEAY